MQKQTTVSWVVWVMNKITIKTKVKTTEQLTRFLEVMEDIEDRFDGNLEVEVEIESREELLERW